MTDSESLEGGNVKGGMLAAHIQWLTERAGKDAVERLVPLVSRQTAGLLSRSILPISWYPFRAIVEIDRAIAQLVGGRPQDVAADLGRHSARVNLGGSYRYYTRPDPHAFFEEAARLHGQFQDFGRVQYERLGPTEGRMSLLEYTCRSKVYCWSAVGFYEEAVAIHGGRTAITRETECANEGAPACRFSIKWQ